METHHVKDVVDTKSEKGAEVHVGQLGSLTKATRNRAKKYRSFDEARAFAASLHLNSRKQWRDYVKGGHSSLPARPTDVPAHPDGIYKTKGWQGWRHWLGTEKAQSEQLS